MVVKDIFIFGATDDGFEVYPVSFHNQFKFLDKDREKTFIKQQKIRANDTLIQYQIGDVKSYGSRPGHQFGYGLLMSDKKVASVSYHEAIRYLDGIYSKAFEGHLGLIKSQKYRYRRFSEIPELDSVLDNILTTINNSPPTFFTSAKGLTSEYISSPLDEPTNSQQGNAANTKDNLSQVQTGDHQQNKQLDSKKSRWKGILIFVSLALSAFALFGVWKLYKQVEGVKKSLIELSHTAASANENSKIDFIRTESKAGKQQLFFHHKSASKSGRFNDKVINIDNFVNIILKVTSSIKNVDKDFIYANNGSDLKKIEDALKTNADLTFNDAFKLLSPSGILIYQDE